MRTFVDSETCMGCGICEGLCPEVFSLGAKDYAVVLLDPVPAEFEGAVKDAMDQCPEAAITIK
jgi:ferredoxin